MDELGPEKYAHAGRSFFEKVEARAGSRKAVAAALRHAGYPVTDQAVGAWILGASEPRDLAVMFWLSERFGVSLDEIRLGKPFQQAIEDRLEAQDRKIRDLERTQDFLVAWQMRDPEFVQAVRRRDEHEQQQEAGA